MRKWEWNLTSLFQEGVWDDTFPVTIKAHQDTNKIIVKKLYNFFRKCLQNQITIQ